MTQPLHLFTGSSYTGKEYNISPGAYSTVTSMGLENVHILAIQLAPFYNAELYSAPAYQGTKMELSGPISIANLNTYNQVLGSTTFGSLKITQNGPTNEQVFSCCMGTDSAANCGAYLPMSGTCDAAMVSTCAGSADARCSCINSKAVTKNVANPKCVDATCVVSGYQTANMRNAACPTVMNCTTTNALANSGIVLIESVKQSCVQSDDAAASATQSGGTSNKVYIIIFIALIALAIIIAAVSFGSDTDVQRAE